MRIHQDNSLVDDRMAHADLKFAAVAVVRQSLSQSPLLKRFDRLVYGSTLSGIASTVRGTSVGLTATCTPHDISEHAQILTILHSF